MKKILLSIIAVSLVSSLAFGQDNNTSRASGPRRQLATIVFAGLGGAILGLSTLSFYGRPQDKLSNIAVGFAIGIIAGTVYVTIKSATTRDYYQNSPSQSLLETSSQDLVADDSLNDSALQAAVVTATPKVIWAPMITQLDEKPASSVYGGQLALTF